MCFRYKIPNTLEMGIFDKYYKIQMYWKFDTGHLGMTLHNQLLSQETATILELIWVEYSRYTNALAQPRGEGAKGAEAPPLPQDKKKNKIKSKN